MSVTDPIADMLTRVRNGLNVRKRYVLIPASRVKEAIAKVLYDEGYIGGYEVTHEGRFPMLRVYLKYTEEREPVLKGLKRVSKPGCRIYTKRGDIPWIRSGLGNVILSTPRGIVSGREARRMGVGGEVICEVW
jgi:small subunit ribosomal protein S8